MNATNHLADHIEGDWLWVQRAKSEANPYGIIHPALRECLTTHQIIRTTAQTSNLRKYQAWQQKRAVDSTAAKSI